MLQPPRKAMELPGSALPSTASDSDFLGHGLHSQHHQQLLDDAAKRRSSSRSIKRRKFDDELVEYSLVPPGAPPLAPRTDKRVRTQSHTGPFAELMASAAAPAPSAPNMPTPVNNEKRKSSSRPSGGSSVNRRSKKKGQLSQLSTKDLGRWKPIDDLALIIGVQQTNDLRTVHRGVKFSCRFTVGELQSRWYALLYNAEISRLAAAALRNLHPDLVAAVHAAALYSTAEEELLATLSSTSAPTVERFQELLDANPGVFYAARTAKALHSHWQLLKQYQLLPDQTVKPLPKADSVLTFSEAEDTVHDSELQDACDELVDVETQLADRVDKKEIRLLENSLPRWQVLVQSVVGGAGGGTELDRNTLAVLRGRLVRYLMRSREIVVGRSTRDAAVDVDLALEGPAGKVSRRQATVRLRNNGDFFMSCEGKRPIFVDGRPVLQGNKVKLNHNSVIEVAGLRFVFLINQDHISAIRQESVKVNIQV